MEGSKHKAEHSQRTLITMSKVINSGENEHTQTYALKILLAGLK